MWLDDIIRSTTSATVVEYGFGQCRSSIAPQPARAENAARQPAPASACTSGGLGRSLGASRK